MVRFLADDPANLVRAAARLATDLERIIAGAGPAAADLANAPLLDGWVPAAVLQSCFVGRVYDHPLLGNRRLIKTSLIYAVDHERGWARTWSRFYRLGATATERAKGGDG